MISCVVTSLLSACLSQNLLPCWEFWCWVPSCTPGAHSCSTGWTWSTHHRSRSSCGTGWAGPLNSQITHIWWNNKIVKKLEGFFFSYSVAHEYWVLVTPMKPKPGGTGTSDSQLQTLVLRLNFKTQCSQALSRQFHIIFTVITSDLDLKYITYLIWISVKLHYSSDDLSFLFPYDA